MAARVTPLHYSLFALEPQHGPSFSLSLLMQVHEAAAVVESGGDAGDAVAIRRRLCGGEGPVGMLGGGGPVETPVHHVGRCASGPLYPTGRRRREPCVGHVEARPVLRCRAESG